MEQKTALCGEIPSQKKQRSLFGDTWEEEGAGARRDDD